MKQTALLAALPAFAVSLFGQAAPRVAINTEMPRVFIAPMEGRLNGFIAAEIIKQRLPLRIVINEKDADLLLTGMSVREEVEKRFYYHRESDQNIGNVQLVDVQTGTMIWAGEAGDRSLSLLINGTDLVFSDRRRNGLRKVAERLVERMKNESFKGQSTVLATATRGPQHISALRAFLLNKNDF